MNVSVGGLVFGLALQVLFLYQVTRLPKIWRGDVPPRWHRGLAATGYTGARNRLAVRSIGVVAVGSSVHMATLIALVFVPKGAGGYVVVGLLFAVDVVMIGLLTSIALFNRPSRLIPPMMRDHT